MKQATQAAWAAGRAARIGLALAALTAFGALGLVVLDRLFPLPTPGRGAPFAMLVTARDGTPLRAFPDQHYVWRNPITPNQVSPLYIEALIDFEDRRFWQHPGVNPFALLRARARSMADHRSAQEIRFTHRPGHASRHGRLEIKTASGAIARTLSDAITT